MKKGEKHIEIRKKKGKRKTWRDDAILTAISKGSELWIRFHGSMLTDAEFENEEGEKGLSVLVLESF